MKATEIEKGDVFRQDGEVLYTVEDAEVTKTAVKVTVRFVDGGSDIRFFDLEAETPLTKD